MSSRRLLQILFAGVLATMLVVTVRASMAESLLDAWPAFAASPWSVATLFDAYFGFLTFYVWVAWRENTTFARIAWFVLIMLLGNIAMAIYVLIQLQRLAPGEPASAILGRRAA
ncbi:MAG: DUF1475 family protein [Thermoanaerobaculia bacterium]|jgi:hypothetical protein